MIIKRHIQPQTRIAGLTRNPLSARNPLQHRGWRNLVRLKGKSAGLSILLLLLFLTQATFAQTWTVETVPNTRLHGNAIHVSDPDGYLSDSTESVINAALCAIRDQADVFVVALQSIGEAEPKRFATQLFNHWGIGDAETDNGVLLLFVEDQRALEFETGYGAEATLTDAQCERIFRTSILPYFRNGDYEGGLCSGVGDIVAVYGGTVPDALMSNLAGRTSYDNDGNGDSTSDEDMMSGFGAMFFLLFLLPIPFISFFRWLADLVNKKKKEKPFEEGFETTEKNGITYIHHLQTTWDASVWKKKGFMRFLLYGIGIVALYVLAVRTVPTLFPDAKATTQDNWAVALTLFVYLSLACIVQNRMLLKRADAKAKESKTPKAVYRLAKHDPHSLLSRIMAPWLGIIYGRKLNKRVKASTPCLCPTCGEAMKTDEGFALPEIQNLEEKLGVYRFSPYLCPSGHRFVEREEGRHYKSFVNCQKCGAHAAKKTGEKTLEEADYEHTGLKEITYTCQHCNVQTVKTKTIPKRVHSTSSDSSSSSRSYGSSSRSSGSFGGGSSGGGGYSGRW